MLNQVLSENFDGNSISYYCTTSHKEMLMECIRLVQQQNVNELVEAEHIIVGVRNILRERKFLQPATPFYLALLFIIKIWTNVEYCLKYATLEEFLIDFEIFVHRDIAQQRKLWKTNNWMHILFKLIPAKGYFGLALASVSKLVEGSEANYIRGKGQRSCVSDREFIYRKVGNVVKLKRKRRIDAFEPPADIISQSEVELAKSYLFMNSRNSYFLYNLNLDADIISQSESELAESYLSKNSRNSYNLNLDATEPRLELELCITDNIMAVENISPHTVMGIDIDEFANNSDMTLY